MGYMCTSKQIPKTCYCYLCCISNTVHIPRLHLALEGTLSMASKLITGGMGAGRMRGVLILNCATSLIPQPSQHSLVSYK